MGHVAGSIVGLRLSTVPVVRFAAAVDRRYELLCFWMA